MGTSAEKFSYLAGTKEAIASAIENKGVSVSDSDTFRSYADKISTISTSQPTDGDYLVQFIGYRGEVLQTGRYSTGDVVSIPADPSYDGLVFDGWSSPVTITDGTVTVTNSDLTIGAMFETESGKTEIDIALTTVTGTTVTLQNITGFTLIEWGDGTTSTELESHTYDAIGEYTISFTGSDMDFGGEDGYIFGQGSSAINYYCTEIRLGGVTSVGNNAFSYCYSLTSITIPNSVTSIGDGAFRTCYSLTSMTFPNSITTIETYICYSCAGLTSLTIPNSVTTIETYTFQGCLSLTSATIPDSVTEIGINMFYGCFSLISLTIPDSMTYTPLYVCRSCYSLTRITIPDTVMEIKMYSLYQCYSLTSLIIPSSVTEIGGYAFQLCYGITEYDFTAFTSTDAVPTITSTSVFNSINGRCKMLFRDQATLDNFASASTWSTYASYMYVKEEE